MKINFLILSILLSLSGVIAQTTEEYHELLKSGNKEQQIEASWELFKHFRLSNRDSALVYAKRNNEIAKEAGDQLALVKSYNALGYINKASGKFYNAIGHYRKALRIAKNNGFVTQEKYLLNNLANIHFSHRDYEKTLNYHFESLKLRRSLNDSLGMGITHSNIGLVYHKLGNYKEAIIQFKKAIKLKNIWPNDFEHSCLNLALSYVMLEEYDSARNIFKDVEMVCEVAECNSEELQILYSEYFYYYLHTMKLDSALSAAETSIELAGVIDSKVKLARGLLSKALVLKVMRNYNEALEVLNNINWMRIDSRSIIADVDELYYEVLKETGNYQKALEHYERFTAYKDSLLNKESLQKMADLRTGYEVGQKQAEVDLLTAEKKNQQIIIYATTGGGLLVLLLLGMVIKNNRDKSKINKQLEQQKQQLESLNQTKDKFFSIISHDLRGPVSAFAGVSRLIKGAMQHNDKEGLFEVADEIDYSVDHLSGLLDNLLNWAMQQQGHFPNVPEKLEVNSLIEQAVGVFSNMAEGKSISLKVNAPDQLYIWADQNSTMTILRNLISNALKFTGEGGEVTVGSRQIGEIAVIEIADNGLGMSQSALENLFKLKGRKSAFGTAGEKGLGLGLQLVYEFVEMNNGTIKVESAEGKGTQFTVQLPLFEAVNQEVAS